MQTRLPARLPAPKLLLLAHVINLEQSGERRSGGWWPEAWSLGVEVLISVLTGFRFTWEPRRESGRGRQRDPNMGLERALDCLVVNPQHVE